MSNKIEATSSFDGARVPTAPESEGCQAGESLFEKYKRLESDFWIRENDLKLEIKVLREQSDERIRQLQAENARLIVAAEKNWLDAASLRDEIERITLWMVETYPTALPPPGGEKSLKEWQFACLLLDSLNRILASNVNSVRVSLEVAGVRDDLVTQLTDENLRLAEERGEANRARGALEAQNERLSAENARLCKSLQTHNNAGIDVTMQLQALRKAVAGYVDQLREYGKNHDREFGEKLPTDRASALASGGVATTAYMVASELDAILRGAGE